MPALACFCHPLYAAADPSFQEFSCPPCIIYNGRGLDAEHVYCLFHRDGCSRPGSTINPSWKERDDVRVKRDDDELLQFAVASRIMKTKVSSQRSDASGSCFIRFISGSSEAAATATDASSTGGCLLVPASLSEVWNSDDMSILVISLRAMVA